MCGIICLVTRNCEEDEIFNKLYEKCISNIKNRGPNSFKSITYDKLKLGASVLWLQGAEISEQPIESSSSAFVYNGDVFGGTAISESSRNTIGDTTLFLKALDTCDIIDVLTNIQGPYAFIYYNKIESKLYFGRDIYGRRSLIIGIHDNNIIITSVGVKNDNRFIELPAIGTFSLDLNTNSFELYPWKVKNLNFIQKFNEIKEFLGCHIVINEKIQISEDINTFIAPTLNDLSILKNIENLDCNLAFKKLLSNDLWLGRVLELKELLELSIKKRIINQPKYCYNCIKNLEHCNHCRIGILFSGGLDCSILALIADKFVDKTCSIDLLNVAFSKNNDFNTPDRLTGLETWNELKTLKPDRCWNFLRINVPHEELDEERSRHICNLIYPLNTVLDDSLGCALWFASRGKVDEYSSPCRVLLVGMGADELFGGYTRHRTALKRKGWIGLFHVLEEDWQNISHRNLARDDRVVSDHGRQLRTPYLDENVVEYVRKLKVWEKTCPSDELAQGLGDKVLLRSLAYHLDLKGAAGFKKRALQFGSRIANRKENAHEVSHRL